MGNILRLAKRSPGMQLDGVVKAFFVIMQHTIHACFDDCR